MKIETVIEQYYNDYNTAEILTSEEVDELIMLLEIIWKELELNANNIRDQVFAYFEYKPVYNLSFNMKPTNSYLQMLRSREVKGDQRSQEWLNQRHNYITASVSAACAGLMGKASRENQILEKASVGKFRPFKGGYYTDIGNIFEPVTNNQYCFINNTRIHDFGLVPNNKEPYTFLAASTDGIAENSTELTNIEIKTLPGRVPDGKVKKVYYHQMQHQMECLGLTHTDFIEVKYDDSYRELTPLKDITNPIGIIAELYNTEDNHYDYEYTAAGSSFSDLEQWIKTRDEIIKGYQNKLLTRWIFWEQTHYSCIRVERDPKWIVNMGPLLMDFYKEMTTLRDNPAEVNRKIRNYEQKSVEKKQSKNELFTDCLL